MGVSSSQVRAVQGGVAVVRVASAALVAAIIVAAGRITNGSARVVAIAGGLSCIVLRLLAAVFGWEWPTLVDR